MKASLGKRIAAYLIDIAIILAILGVVGLLYKPDISGLNASMADITFKYAEGEVSFSNYMTELSFIYQQMDLKNIILHIINVVFIIAYFIVLPYFNHGQTIGKRLRHIEVRAKSNQSLNLFNLFIRNLIINGLTYLLSVIICVFIVPANLYFTVISFLALIQIGLLLASALMVVYRKDKKGLHDLIAGTWVATSK